MYIKLCKYKVAMQSIILLCSGYYYLQTFSIFQNYNCCKNFGMFNDPICKNLKICTVSIIQRNYINVLIQQSSNYINQFYTSQSKKEDKLFSYEMSILDFLKWKKINQEVKIFNNTMEPPINY